MPVTVIGKPARSETLAARAALIDELCGGVGAIEIARNDGIHPH
jgi:hypothetical protein